MPKGTTLYTVLRRVSRSGMTRFIDVILWQDNQPRQVVVRESTDCTKDAQTALEKWGADYKVTGCGMDMGFDLIYRLGYLIKGNGYWFNQKWL